MVVRNNIYTANGKTAAINACLKNLPPSQFKSIRQLAIASLTDGKSILENFGMSKDSELMISALRKFGWEISVSKNRKHPTIKINGGIKHMKPCFEKIDLGSSGLSYRLATAISSLGVGKYFITGNNRMKKRTIKSLEKAMKKLNLVVISNNGFPPVVVSGIGQKQIKGGRFFLSGKATSQFHTAALIAFSQNIGGIEISSDMVVSQFYVEMTKNLIEKAGIMVKASKGFEKIVVAGGQKFKPFFKTRVETDVAMLSYYLFLIALVGGKLTIEVPHEDVINDKWVIPLLSKTFGCKTRTKKDLLIIESKGACKVFDVDGSTIPFLLPTLAMMALAANGKCRIRNVASSNNKMTARKDDTIPTVLRKIGALVKVTSTDLFIDSFNMKKKAAIITRKEHKDDHRIVMALGILAQHKDFDIKIENPSAASKTFPEYFKFLDSIIIQSGFR